MSLSGGIRPILCLVGTWEGSRTLDVQRGPQVDPSAELPCPCSAVGLLPSLGAISPGFWLVSPEPRSMLQWPVWFCFQEGWRFYSIPYIIIEVLWLIPAKDAGMGASTEFPWETALWSHSLSKLSHPDPGPSCQIPLQQRLLCGLGDVGTH